MFAHYITPVLELRLAPVASRDILTVFKYLENSKSEKKIEYCATEDGQPQINCYVLYMLAVPLISIDSVFTA